MKKKYTMLAVLSIGSIITAKDTIKVQNVTGGPVVVWTGYVSFMGNSIKDASVGTLISSSTDDKPVTSSITFPEWDLLSGRRYLFVTDYPDVINSKYKAAQYYNTLEKINVNPENANAFSIGRTASLSKIKNIRIYRCSEHKLCVREDNP